MLEGSAIALFLVSVPTRLLLSGWNAPVGLREVVLQTLESVKGTLVRTFWERTQLILKAYGEEAVLEAYEQQVYGSRRRVGVHRWVRWVGG